MKVVAFVAVGSNIRPAENIPAALERLMDVAEVTGVSTFYRVRPIDRPAQPDYRNGAFRVETDCDAVAFHGEVLRQIENDIGRERVADRHAARPIDLDLVLYGDSELDEDGLILPDPDIFERNFLAAPLSELAPEDVVPGDGRTLQAIATELGREGLVIDRPLTRTLTEILCHEHKSR